MALNKQAALAHYADWASQIMDEMAREHVLADIDTFADELGAACMGKGSVSSLWESRDHKRLEAAPLPIVLHALLTAGQSGDRETAVLAAKILGDRYLAGQHARVQSYRDLLVLEVA